MNIGVVQFFLRLNVIISIEVFLKVIRVKGAIFLEISAYKAYTEK